MEGGGDEGRFGVPGGHQGGMQVISRGSEEASGAEGRASEGEEGEDPGLEGGGGQTAFSFLRSFLCSPRLLFPLFCGHGEQEIRAPQYDPVWLGTGLWQ